MRGGVATAFRSAVNPPARLDSLASSFPPYAAMRALSRAVRRAVIRAVIRAPRFHSRENRSPTSIVLRGVRSQDSAYKCSLLACILGTLFATSGCGNGPPSTADCVARWNHPGYHDSQAAVVRMDFPRAHVAGWPSKAGDHCSVTFFTAPGEPWVTYVLWLDAPEPRELFGRNATGSRYGQGELGAEKPIPPNTLVTEDGILREQ